MQIQLWSVDPLEFLQINCKLSVLIFKAEEGTGKTDMEEATDITRVAPPNVIQACSAT